MSEKIQPKVRFSGFTNAWEQRKFKDMVVRRSETSHDSKFLTVEFEDINSGVGTLNKDVSKKSKHKSGIIFHSGDVLFGKLRPYLKNWLHPNFVGIAVGDFWVFDPGQNNGTFIYYLIQSMKYQQASNLSIGSKMPRSDWNTVANTIFNIPNLSEQTIIGEYLEKLDNLIAANQSKLEELKTVKKLAMQKIFDQEWRFRGFTDPWEQRKLGDITTSYSGGTPKSKNKTFYSGTIPFIRSGEISSNFTQLFVTNEAIENSSAKYVKKGQLLFALYGATSGEAAISKINGVINQAVLAINFNGNVYFLLTFLKNKKIDILKTYLQGGQGNLSGDIFKKLVITIPKISEQEHIGIFFKTIDSLIAANQQKCDQLKKMKKWCMQNLFV